MSGCYARSVLCLAFLVAVTLLPVRAHAAPGQTRSYSNSKYGFAITYPADRFIPQGESDAGDGQVFRARGGQGEMRVYAGFNVLNESLAAVYETCLREPGFQPTYKVLRRNWFVISGLAGKNIFYRKTIQSGDTFYTISFTYPPGEKALFDPLIPGLLADFAIMH
ncbi:MAG: hypothetical protein AB7D37_18350 [Desulfovibrio sp.]